MYARGLGEAGPVDWTQVLVTGIQTAGQVLQPGTPTVTPMYYPQQGMSFGGISPVVLIGGGLLLLLALRK